MTPAAHRNNLGILLLIGTTGHNNHISTAQGTPWLAPVSRRQQRISLPKFFRRHEDDVQIPIQIPVLKSIIEQNTLSTKLDSLLCSTHAVFIHNDQQIGIFASHLYRLVSRFMDGRQEMMAVTYYNRAGRFPFISPAENSNRTFDRRPFDQQLNNGVCPPRPQKCCPRKSQVY